MLFFSATRRVEFRDTDAAGINALCFVLSADGIGGARVSSPSWTQCDGQRRQRAGQLATRECPVRFSLGVKFEDVLTVTLFRGSAGQ